MVVSVTLFGWAITILSIIVLWSWNIPLIAFILWVVRIRLVYSILAFILVEPYEICGTLSAYYKVMQESSPGELDGAKGVLASKSESVRELLEMYDLPIPGVGTVSDTKLDFGDLVSEVTSAFGGSKEGK
jgi:hypothetical protein